MRIFKSIGLSRLLEHLRKDEKFAVISAYREEKTEAENRKRHEQLIPDVRKFGYGYFVLRAKWGVEGKEPSVERSLFIPHMSRDEAVEMGDRYDQYSVLVRDESGILEVASSDKYGKKKGEVIRVFSDKPSISEQDFVGFFSQLAKGTGAARSKRVQLRELQSCIHRIAFAAEPDGHRLEIVEHSFILEQERVKT